jgi:hypothetical protein
VAAVVAAALGLGIGLGTTGSGGVVDDPRAAAAILKSVLAAVGSAGSFHYVSSSTSSSPTATRLTQVTVGDAGPSSGRQVITIGTSHFEVVVVGSTAYFKGDAVATSASLGLSAALARTYAGRWISLVSGDQPYQSVYAAVTASSAIADNITFTPRSELAAAKIGGTDVIGLRGGLTPIDGQAAKGIATLYVTAGRRHLPVRYVEKGTVGSGPSRATLNFQIAFSAWGNPVSVPAPTGVVPFSSLGASGGSNGSGLPSPTILT